MNDNLGALPEIYRDPDKKGFRLVIQVQGSSQDLTLREAIAKRLNQAGLIQQPDGSFKYTP